MKFLILNHCGAGSSMGTRNNNDHRGRQQEKKRPNSAIEKFIIVLSRVIYIVHTVENFRSMGHLAPQSDLHWFHEFSLTLTTSVFVKKEKINDETSNKICETICSLI